MSIDRAFFEREVMALLDALYGAALRLAKNPADAEDLVAETIRKAWAGKDGLEDPGSLRGWLFRILSNTFIGECRKQRTTSLEGLADGEDGDGSPEFSLFERLHQPFLLWWSNPEQEFLNGLLRRDLQRALDGLPETFRVVVVLSELEGFTYQEIAAMLEIPVGTVRSRLSRGRSLLQKTLWDDARAGRGAEGGSAAPVKQRGAR